MVTQREQLSPRSQRLLDHLESAWQDQEQLLPDSMKRITGLVLRLSEEYSAAGLREIANDIISSMHMHMLKLIDTFQEKAEEEGISAIARDKTLTRVVPETFAVMEKIHTQLHVRSLDDLVALVNVATSLQTLSQTDSAEEVHSWLYELPMMFYRQLSQLGLITYAYGFQKSRHTTLRAWRGASFVGPSKRTDEGSVVPATRAFSLEQCLISTALENGNAAAYAV
jgi:hypothetical protein